MGQEDIASVKRSIPVIDFSGLNDPAKRSYICAEVAKASETVGFFEICNYGVRPEICEEAFAASREFFDLPIVDKLKCSKPAPTGIYKRVYPFQRGYKQSFTTEGIVNRNERFTLRHRDPNARLPGLQPESPDSATDRNQNAWPETPKNYREKVEKLLNEIGVAADDVLDIFSESLGFPSNFLRELCPAAARYVNLLHYPKAVQEEGAEEFGAMAHRDLNVFTIVTQSGVTDGLEIKQDEHSDWTPLHLQSGTLIVNVGDVLEVFSNGRYKSILHRVVSNKKESRLSVAYFMFPAGPGEEEIFMVEPIPALVELDKTQVFSPVALHHCLTARLHESMSARIAKQVVGSHPTSSILQVN